MAEAVNGRNADGNAVTKSEHVGQKPYETTASRWNFFAKSDSAVESLLKLVADVVRERSAARQ
ncbi:MAG: hypothetical protein JWN74_3152 [Acidobacteriaceae bacterium]|nr:hypothetical protein [Acidobacteriaceae bacterium]